ncbi:Uma2 family endonuclease [Streptomyces armeniacus]|uniref:Uma2 family endonuclease n=1 Tax=Streptomyces armeniacus TaxID=83291 RepID=A0A345XKB1_9ACTN|nr:Uma2 family endonuclease [Streptomyces armeniacus]AXK32077.1 Uma2 family endonuclease [Streptomyces armeniacus]
MSVDPAVEPVAHQDPADLLIAIEKASAEPIRPEYVEGLILVPPQPDYQHSKGAFKLSVQLDAAGFGLAGMGNGYRVGQRSGATLALVIPDFYVLHREPTDLDEAYRKAHKGWYPIDLVALAGEVTSTNHETDSGPKLRACATAEIPVYVLVHRQHGTAYAYSEPLSDPEDSSRSHYRAVSSVELGGKLQLPEPYPALDTGPLLRG